MATINSGITMRILPLTQYGFTGIGASKNISFPIGQHIEAGVFTEADLLVRLHSGTTMSAGQTLSVSLAADGYDFEDPANVFITSPLVSFTQSGAPTSLPVYSVVTASASALPFGRYVAIVVSASQPAVAAAFNVNLSVDLTLKGGDPRAMPMSPNSFRGYRLL
jgi:hypothetical protein